MVYAYFVKRVMGDFLRALEKSGAGDEESAKTITELGFGKAMGLLIRMSLGKGATLRRFVGAAIKPEDESAPDNIPQQKYFLFPEKQNEALRRYKKDGTSIPVLIGCIALLIAAAIICTLVVPYFRNIMSGVTDNFDTGENEEVVDNVYDENVIEDVPETDAESTEDENSVPQTRFETAE